MDQKFQKWVSDTSTGQKQHIFTHSTSKNHVLVPSGTPQLWLKTCPNQVLLGKMLLFQSIFGPLGNDQKIQKLISSTCMWQKQSFFTHISCKIYFILLVGPLQLNLKIAIFLSFVREKKNCVLLGKMATFRMCSFFDGLWSQNILWYVRQFGKL